MVISEECFALIYLVCGRLVKFRLILFSCCSFSVPGLPLVQEYKDKSNKLNKKELSSLVCPGSTLNSFRLFSRSFAEDAIIIQRRIVICNHHSLQFLG